MDVQAILSTKGTHVATIRPDSNLLTAARFLRAKGVGALVVSSDGRRAEGIVSERDIVVALAEHPENILSRPVSEVMNRAFVAAKPTDTLQTVMAAMTRHRQRHVPVLQGGELVGLVSIGDVVRHRIDEVELQSAVARDLAIVHS